MIDVIYSTLEQIDDRISELTSEIEILEFRIVRAEGATWAGDLLPVLEASKDTLDAELEILESFSTEITRTGTDEDCVDAALDYACGDLDRAAELVRYGVSTYATAAEYGEQLITDNGALDPYRAYFDFDQFGRDCLQDTEYHEFRNCIYIFNC